MWVSSAETQPQHWMQFRNLLDAQDNSFSYKIPSKPGLYSHFTALKGGSVVPRAVLDVVEKI
jgi:hypothetical protein